LLQSGKVLLTAQQAAQRGAVTFGALVATSKLIEANHAAVQQFVNIVDKYYRDFETTPAHWTADADNVKKLAHFTGAKADDIAARLKVSVFIPANEQAGSNWLGGDANSGIAKVLASTAEFLKEQKKINQVLDSYAPFADPRFVRAVLASN
jgi:taurine transport system substrate-binding protein